MSGENNFWCECGPPAWKFTNKTAYISCNKTVEIVINDEIAFWFLSQVTDLPKAKVGVLYLKRQFGTHITLLNGV